MDIFWQEACDPDQIPQVEAFEPREEEDWGEGVSLEEGEGAGWQRIVLAPGKQVLMSRVDFPVIEKGEGPTSSFCCRCGACKVGTQGWGFCVRDGQSDRHQAGRRHEVDGPRQTDGWVAEADGSRSVGRQDDGQ